jgi:hypothetical protein
MAFFKEEHNQREKKKNKEKNGEKYRKGI